MILRQGFFLSFSKSLSLVQGKGAYQRVINYSIQFQIRNKKWRLIAGKEGGLLEYWDLIERFYGKFKFQPELNLK